MKKHIIALAALLAFNMTGYAAEATIDITDVEIDRQLVTVKAVNNLQSDTIFTLTVLKVDESDTLSEQQEIYSVMQETVKAKEEKVFKFIIGDGKMGVSSAGTYKISVQNLANEKDTETIIYADTAAINAFVAKLKEEDAKVSDSDKAYELLLPIVYDEANRAVIYTIGVDFVQFDQNAETVKNETMNLLHKDGISSLDATTLPVKFRTAFGLAVYNTGEKAEGMEIMSPEYSGEKVDSIVLSGAMKIMKNSYASVSEIESAFTTAYGLETVNAARVEEMHDTLDVFVKEVGECKSAVNQIKALTPVKQNKAYEYMVERLGSGTLETVSELETLLKEAYNSATAGSTAGGGTGRGGISGGSFNSSAVKDALVTSPQGSGTTDEKAETTHIFSDLPVDHWAAESVDYLKKAGIVNGTDTGAFEPDRFVTREEFAKMLVAACGFETENRQADFADIKDDAWYVTYIGAAVENGIVNGIGDNKFGVGQNITRQDMAVMTARAIEKKSVVLSKLKDYTAFSDETAIADYAVENIKILYEAGIINGKGENCFDPTGNATRAEAAKILYEAFK